jgi:hypothetical protein
MSTLKAFDPIAALSPDLALAIREGRADPRRWQNKSENLIDRKTGQYLYPYDNKTDQQIES